jgi:hypothetical protein
MKKILLLSICLIVSVNLFSQIKVNSNGFVGINNTSPAYRLDVIGNLKVKATTTSSITFDGYELLPYEGTISLGTSQKPWNNFWCSYPYFYSSPVIISDKNFKTNITSFSRVMDKVAILNPVQYKLRSDLPISVSKINSTFQYGFIAQEVQEVFPEIVTQMEDGSLGIRYTELIPVLVQALKEQQEEIVELKQRIAKLEQAGK